MDGSGGGSIILLLVLGIYLLPTIIAFSRGVSDRGAVAVINVFLGWTFMGWVVSLARACGAR